MPEAIIATFSALSCNAAEEAIRLSLSSDDVLPEIFSTMTVATKGLIVDSSLPNHKNSDQRISLVHWLVAGLHSLPRHIRKIEGKPVAFSTLRAAETLLEASRQGGLSVELFESVAQCQFSFAGIFQVMFAYSAMISHPRLSLESLQLEKMKILIEAIERYGQALQRQDLEKEVASQMLGNFGHVIHLASFFLQKIGNNQDEAQLSVAQSVLYLLSSISLVSRHRLMNFGLWVQDRSQSDISHSVVNYAKKLVLKSLKFLDGMAECESDWYVLSRAILPVIKLYNSQLSCSGSECVEFRLEVDLFIKLRNIVEVLAAESASSSSLIDTARQCIIACLFRLGDLLQFYGETLHALQVTVWAKCAASTDYEAIRPWLESKLLAIQSSEVAMLTFAPEVEISHVHYRSAVEAECRACHLRMRVKIASDIQELQDIEEIIFALIDDMCMRENHTSDSLHLWTKTTGLMALSECLERRGDVLGALNVGLECYQCTRTLFVLLSGSRKAASKTGTLLCETAVLDTLPLRCIERQLECLVRISSSHLKLGDRKEVMYYMSKAMELSGSSWISGIDKKAGFLGFIAASRSNLCHNNKEFRLRRLFLSAMARATSLDCVSNAFQPVSAKPLFSKQNDWTLLGNRVESELEQVFDTAAGESFCVQMVLREFPF